MNIAVAPRPIAVSFEDLTLGYERHPAVHHLTGEIHKGDLLAVVGPNGAGKSTLLKGIMGELRPLGGRISLNGARVREIAYLPQQNEIDRSFPISVFDCVAMGLWHDIGIWRSVDSAGKRAVIDALATVGLEDFDRRSVGSLSGGQFQRVLFARLLLQDAALVLLDEPFRAVDSKTVDDLVRLILHWHAEGRTIVAALHDLEQVRSYFPHTMVLARELVAWGESSKVLAPETLTKARQLCEAWDADAAICERGEHEAQRKIA
ncbi:MAG TPA: zinc ABC transporter ATP-binding protein AztA [Xanthobacteraceae bacterium]